MFERIKLYWSNSSKMNKLFIVVTGLLVVGAIMEPSPKPAPVLTKEEAEKAALEYKLSKMSPEKRRAYEDMLICVQYKMERTQNPKITFGPPPGCQ